MYAGQGPGCKLWMWNDPLELQCVNSKIAKLCNFFGSIVFLHSFETIRDLNEPKTHMFMFTWWWFGMVS